MLCAKADWKSAPPSEVRPAAERGLEAPPAPKNWEGEFVKLMARLVSAEVGAARFGELAPGEVVMLLKRAKEMKPLRRVGTILYPVFMGALVLHLGYTSAARGNVDPLVWILAASVVVYVVGNWIQAGWLPVVYSLEWSPAGLSARLLWWSDVIPPGTEVAVRFGLIVTAVRSPGGRWYPVPGVVFDQLVEARGEGGE